MRLGRGALYAVGAATAFGGVGVLAKLAFLHGWDLPSLLAWRFALAAAVLAPLALHGSGGWRGFPAAVALGGVGYVAMTAFYFSSFRSLPVAASTFMLYLAPALVAFYAWRFQGVTRRLWLGGLSSSILGLALMFGTGLGGGLSLVGLTLAGASAATYAGCIVVGKHVAGTLAPSRGALGISLGASLTYGVVALAQGDLLIPRTLTAWGVVVALGVLSTAVALLLFYAALARAPATEVAIVSTLEPVAALLLAYLALGESLPPLALVGGVLIAVGAGLAAVEGPVGEVAVDGEGVAE